MFFSFFFFLSFSCSLYLQSGETWSCKFDELSVNLRSHKSFIASLRSTIAHAAYISSNPTNSVQEREISILVQFVLLKSFEVISVTKNYLRINTFEEH